MQNERAHTSGRPANLGQLSACQQFDGAKADLRPRDQLPPATVSAIISHAEDVHSMSLHRLGTLSAVTTRAIDLAARLAGPFPIPGHDPIEKSSRADVAGSALEEAQRRVAELRRPLTVMDMEFARLTEALDAIERAIG